MRLEGFEAEHLIFLNAVRQPLVILVEYPQRVWTCIDIGGKILLLLFRIIQSALRRIFLTGDQNEVSKLVRPLTSLLIGEMLFPETIIGRIAGKQMFNRQRLEMHLLRMVLEQKIHLQEDISSKSAAIDFSI